MPVPDPSIPEQRVAFGTSGTKNIYKIYAESFRGQQHLEQILSEADTTVQSALTSQTVSK